MVLFRRNINVLGRQYNFCLDLDPADATERAILAPLEDGVFYEPDVSGILGNVLRQGDVFVDVGANIGYFSCLAGLLVGDTGKVIAFEPSPKNVVRLKSNIEHSSVNTLTLIENPASARIEELSFFLNSDDRGGNALWNPGEFPENIKSKANPEEIRLTSTTLDEVAKNLKLRDIKLIKIDTEGAEYDILKGACNILSTQRVPFIVAELNEFGLRKMGSSQMGLRGYMAQFGYETFCLYHRGCLPKLIPRGTQIRMPCIGNILFSTVDQVSRYWPVDFFDSAISPEPK